MDTSYREQWSEESMRKRSVPDFFIVGAPKCGTTALASYLRAHPETYVPQSELNYFAPDMPGWNEDVVDQYYTAFAAGSDSAVVGAKSAWYLYSSVAVPNLLDTNPQIKLIAMVRNPIEMARSLHSQLLWEGTEDIEDFQRAWALQEERARGRMIPRGCARLGRPGIQPGKVLVYRDVCALGTQIERFINTVPRKQRLVIVLDDLASRPRTVYQQVLDFLGLEPDGRTEFPRVNAHKAPRSPHLARLINRPPAGVNIMRSLLCPLLQRCGLHLRPVLVRLNTVHPSQPSLPETFRADLRRVFEAEIRKLERLLGRSFAHWMYSPS